MHKSFQIDDLTRVGIILLAAKLLLKAEVSFPQRLFSLHQFLLFFKGLLNLT